MTKKRSHVLLNLTTVVSLCLGSTTIQAQDEEETFQVGGSCAALAYLAGAELRSFIAAGYTDDHHSFCFPEEPSECSDYSSFLHGTGRLVTGEDGYHCSLMLQQ